MKLRRVAAARYLRSFVSNPERSAPCAHLQGAFQAIVCAAQVAKEAVSGGIKAASRLLQASR